MPGIEEETQKEWVVGCEECQDACPYNRKHDWNLGEEIPSLTEIAPKLVPEYLAAATDEFLKEEVVPRTFDHIFENEIETIRICAKRSLKNREKLGK